MKDISVYSSPYLNLRYPFVASAKDDKRCRPTTSTHRSNRQVVEALFDKTDRNEVSRPISLVSGPSQMTYPFPRIERVVAC